MKEKENGGGRVNILRSEEGTKVIYIIPLAPKLCYQGSAWHPESLFFSFSSEIFWHSISC